MMIPTNWCLVYAVEGIFIFLGNALTTVVFWRRKFALKRTSYLLVNLAVSDSMVGVTTIVFATINIIMNETMLDAQTAVIIISRVNLISVSASIFSLACVALERLFAFWKPLNHRTTKTRYYFYAVSLVWVLALVFCSLSVIDVYVFDSSTNLGIYISVVAYSTSLIIICISYTLIWWVISKRPAQQLHQRQQNKRIAVTLFAVTLLSLITFVPGEVGLIMERNSIDGIPLLDMVASGVAWFLVYGNSLMNPFVYALRMPEFRREATLLCC